MENWDMKRLRDELISRGLNTEGKKSELIRRIKDAEKGESQSISNAASTDQTFFSFKDLEESMNTFDGDDNYSVENFLADFEETAEMCLWSDLQKFIYVKRLLRGTAKLLLRTINVSNYKDLACVLKDEFHVSISKSKVLLMMMNRKKLETETFLQYTLKMRELQQLSNGDIDDETVIQFIIDGIEGDEIVKMCLYGVTTFQAILTIHGNEVTLNKIKTKNDDLVNNRNEEHSIMTILLDESNNDEIDLSHILDKNHRNVVNELIMKYDPANKCKDTCINSKIILKNETPIYERPRRLSVKEKAEVDEIISKWLAEGIIQHSQSDFASAIALVKKKNGSTRLCVDYRKLNKEIVKDRYPLPLIQDQLDSLRGIQVFSTIDLKNGFFHVPVHEESRKYTSIETPSHQYEFLKTPFEVAFGTKIRKKMDPRINEIIDAEVLNKFIGDREKIRNMAKTEIRRIQESNRKQYNKKRKKQLCIMKEI